MGVPKTGIEVADQPAAEGLLSAFKTIDSAERQRHAQVLSYWLSIRGDKEFPPLHDLDPLEISDAGPSSVLVELISGGHDADIRHLGEALRHEGWPEQIMDAPNPSILACIAKKLPIVAISRDFLAFEDEYSNDEGTTRCWVTLLPLSGGGAWVDYVYALVSFDAVPAKSGKSAEKPAKKAEAKEAAPERVEHVEEPAVEEIAEPVAEAAPEEDVAPEPVVEEIPNDDDAEQVAEAEPEAVEEPELVSDEPEADPEEVEEPVAEIEETAALEVEEEPKEPVAAAIAKAAPGFSKLFDSLAGLTGFYAQGVKVEPVIPEETNPADAHEDSAPEPEPEPETAQAEEPAKAAEEEQVSEKAADEEPAREPVEEEARAKPAKQPTRASEGVLQSKLTEVRAKADEARQARLRANSALYEGLSAAYDFALDAEDSPEEYLRMVEAKGLKIQLRSPMTPVVKLAFDGLCDDVAISQLEAVLAWALAEDLPRGSLAERIEAAGGIAPLLSGAAAN
ncbi:MAG: hypothetical protein ACTHJK_01565 [Sphingomicrobium sp.]